MKKLLFSLFLICCSPLLFAFSQQDLASLLQQPNNIQGAFVQQRYLKALNTPITSSGKFVLLKEKGLLWNTEKPFTNQMRVLESGISQWNGSEWISNPKLGQAQQIKLFLGLLSGDSQSLGKQFEFALTGTKQQWQLILTPSSLLMKQIFTDIVIEGKNSVERIELNEKQGDRTLIIFKNQKINQTLTSFAKQALQ